jgi:hypothetical protein
MEHMFKITIDHDNDAFDQDMIYPEISRMLREVATALDLGNLDIHNLPEVILRDVNGNRVGKAEFVE